MAASDHTQGAGFHPFRAARGGLRALLQGFQQAGADNRWVRWVAPLGPRTALVKNEDNDQVYQVGNASGKTYPKGTVVLVGSNNGQRDEVVLSGPSPGRTGGASFPTQVLRGGLGGGAPAKLGKCPAPITGRTYVALFYGDYAALYQDAVYVRALSPRNSMPVGKAPLPEAEARYFQWIAGDRVVFSTQLDAGSVAVHTWDATTGVDSVASWVAAVEGIDFVSAPLALADGFSYFLGGLSSAGDGGTPPTQFYHLQIYRVSTGAAGTVSPSPVGPPFDPTTIFAAAAFNGLASPAPGVFDCIPFLDSGTTFVPSLSGGTWQPGTGRVAAPGDYFFRTGSGGPGDVQPANGQPIDGGGSLRTNGILPAGKSDVLRTPAAWHAIWGQGYESDGFTIQIPQVNTSVSPSGLEYSIYPVYNRLDEATGWGIDPPGMMRLLCKPYPESPCGMPMVPVGPDPDGRSPDIMLARDF